MRVMALRSPRVASSRVELWVGQVAAVQRGPRGKNGFVPQSESRRRQCPTTKTKCGVMMESPPAAPLIVPQAKLLLQLFVIPLNDPSLLRRRYQCRQVGIRRKAPQPVLRWFRFACRPFDQQPLLRQRFTPFIIPIRRPDTHCRKTGLQLLLCAIAPGDRLPFLGGKCAGASVAARS